MAVVVPKLWWMAEHLQIANVYSPPFTNGHLVRAPSSGVFDKTLWEYRLLWPQIPLYFLCIKSSLVLQTSQWWRRHIENVLNRNKQIFFFVVCRLRFCTCLWVFYLCSTVKHVHYTLQRTLCAGCYVCDFTNHFGRKVPEIIGQNKINAATLTPSAWHRERHAFISVLKNNILLPH